MRALHCLLLLTSVSTALSAEPLAWLRLGQPDGQRYADTPYHWLGDASLHLRADLPPGKEYAVAMLWGAKGDQRAAVLTFNGQSEPVTHGGYDGFRWQRVLLPAAPAEQPWSLTLEGAAPKAAFLAAVAILAADDSSDPVLPEGAAGRLSLVQPPPPEVAQWAQRLREEKLDVWERAALHGKQANEALRRCRKYVDGWLAHADPKTGLIPRNLGRDSYFWNGRDAGADNYAFMVLTAALTDHALFNGRMLDMLRTETEVATRLGALPADYDFRKQGFRHEVPDVNRLIFDGSEYVKDGLMPITEWLGPTPWSERMLGIIDSILEHAPYPTSNGPIPSNNVEVNGEMMQVLSRLCFMTGDDKYLDMACRIADYYLLGNHHPTRDASQLKLRDHGCELISGLTEVYAACHFRREAKAAAYRDPLYLMLDRILEVGVNEHGLMYDLVNPQTGEVLRNVIGDNWGYNYNGFYTVCLLDNHELYREATRKALASLKPHYWKFPWQGWGSDGIADSVEGAINLYNREPDVEGVADWIDENLTRMLLIQKADGVIEGWHGDGNYARTALLWVLWKQQGVTVQPWREEVCLGAVREGEALYLSVRAEEPWQGRLIFDRPRHKAVMHLPLDYPRINQFPEWFTTQPGDRWSFAQKSGRQTHTGEELLAGLPMTLAAGEEVRITVTAAK